MINSQLSRDKLLRCPVINSQLSRDKPLRCPGITAHSRRSQEPVHHLGEGHQGPAEPAARGRRGRHGDGHRQEGQAGAQEKGAPRRGDPAAQILPQEGRRVPLLRGQRRRHRQQQRGDERLSHHWPCGQRMCRSVAQDRLQRRQHRLSPLLNPLLLSWDTK